MQHDAVHATENKDCFAKNRSTRRHASQAWCKITEKENYAVQLFGVFFQEKLWRCHCRWCGMLPIHRITSFGCWLSHRMKVQVTQDKTSTRVALQCHTMLHELKRANITCSFQTQGADDMPFGPKFMDYDEKRGVLLYGSNVTEGVKSPRKVALVHINFRMAEENAEIAMTPAFVFMDMIASIGGFLVFCIIVLALPGAVLNRWMFYRALKASRAPWNNPFLRKILNTFQLSAYCNYIVNKFSVGFNILLIICSCREHAV